MALDRADKWTCAESLIGVVTEVNLSSRPRCTNSGRLLCAPLPFLIASQATGVWQPTAPSGKKMLLAMSQIQRINVAPTEVWSQQGEGDVLGHDPQTCC